MKKHRSKQHNLIDKIYYITVIGIIIIILSLSITPFIILYKQKNNVNNNNINNTSNNIINDTNNDL